MKEYLHPLLLTWGLIAFVWFLVAAITHAYYYTKFLMTRHHVWRMKEQDTRWEAETEED